MAAPNLKPSSPIPAAVSTTEPVGNQRDRSVTTRMTAADFSLVEAAGDSAGVNVSAWVRDAAVAQARAASGAPPTDPILLAELMAIRTLMVNLISLASKGPLTDESLREMLAYSESIKQQTADDYLAKLRAKGAAR